MSKKDDKIIAKHIKGLESKANSKIKITTHDYFFYTDAKGNTKKIKGVKLFSKLFDATEILSDIKQFISMHDFHRQGLHKINDKAKYSNLARYIWDIEYKLYNMQYVFELGGVFKGKNRKEIISLYQNHYKVQYYTDADFDYIHETYYRLSDTSEIDKDWLQQYAGLKDKYISRITNLMVSSLDFKSMAQEPEKIIKYGKIPIETRFKEFYWLCDPDNADKPISELLNMMNQDKDLFRTTFNRWWGLIHTDKEFLLNGTLRNPSRPWKPIDPTEHYELLEGYLEKKGVLPIRNVLDPRIFSETSWTKKNFHMFLVQILFNKFKWWFDRKNEKGLVLQWHEIGTKDVRTPHMMTMDKTFETRIAEENRQQRLLENRVAESEAEVIKGMTFDEVMTYIHKTDLDDKIEIV